MSEGDPNIYSRPDKRLNPASTSYAPDFQPPNNMSSQVSGPPSPYLEARVFSLEEEHASLRGELKTLTEMYHTLSSSVNVLKKDGWPVTVGPFQDQALNQSHQCALKFKQELEELTMDVHKLVNGVTDLEKAKGTATPNANGDVPSHLRNMSGASKGTVSRSLPPHLRGKTMNK
jgi:hypothetical protein